MRHIPNIAGVLLGLLFVVFSSMVLFDFGPKPPEPAAGSYPALFMSAFVPSGYLKFVKVLELLGGVLVAIPKTRGLGILVLGPIVVNIFAYHWFIMQGEGVTSPILLAVGALTVVCILAERRPLLALMCK